MPIFRAYSDKRRSLGQLLDKFGTKRSVSFRLHKRENDDSDRDEHATWYSSSASVSPPLKVERKDYLVNPFIELPNPPRSRKLNRKKKTKKRSNGGVVDAEMVPSVEELRIEDQEDVPAAVKEIESESTPYFLLKLHASVTNEILLAVLETFRCSFEVLSMKTLDSTWMCVI